MNYLERWKEIIRPLLDEAFEGYGDPTRPRTLLAHRIWRDGNLEQPSRFLVRQPTEDAKNAVLIEFAIPLRDVNPDDGKVALQFDWA